ncbi:MULTISPECIES: ribonuclease G [unclassified Oceanobacter]|jgi:ribonuclease G|uniref:ribonuclease G n=1 Tax=unclassified Oceanobacter TaxID=2620260 RepID=UPI0026E26C6C|nr:MULTISPECIES: ribonuclease G [unclassified Oceanobacter]MDO6681995.1 ribonuclease G [Oceanobacter sp. 5_MG-2023]MDP2505357.1 ribonuclease G [Oceanobacter sp. 3_MG-2023]MDP2548031.1 ribonuclease G [Oceanobacter sp. 4_MG-2023]MDP2610115.1 ribonuclease G [Oceanobacter sp. 1_MG-2023]MDP2612310.1 ribonuclease G [Oceanobacter sp. 2_MG-2023]
MNAEILMNITPTETRVAVVENGVLQEIVIERTNHRGLVGNIYKGKVVRVLPGMQAAFVNIGLERAAFIHAAELGHPDSQTPINQLLHEGQSLVVQVTKDPIGTKGARLTTQLTIPSRYLVYMPGADHVGVSQRIDDGGERDRLKHMVQDCMDAEGLTGEAGFILRTAAEGVGEEEILADTRYLRRLWRKLEERINEFSSPAVVYDELPLYLRTLRDYARPEVDKILVDSRETFEKILQFSQQYVPEIEDHLNYYHGPRPVFELYSVEDEIQRALERKVPLKSGGYLVIDQTEAMTTIDVNTGGFVGRRNLEETIYKTNLEAANAIGRQLRLRNLGGIIILDFIDMTEPEHQRQVLRMLEKVLEKDHAKTKISGVSELGLVEMTRKRTRESLEQMLMEPCKACDGRGSVKTPETVCYEIFREILREDRAYGADTYLVLASQPVLDRLQDEDSDGLADLEAFIGKTIKLQVESLYAQDYYDIILQ